MWVAFFKVQDLALAIDPGVCHTNFYLCWLTISIIYYFSIFVVLCYFDSPVGTFFWSKFRHSGGREGVLRAFKVDCCIVEDEKVFYSRVVPLENVHDLLNLCHEVVIVKISITIFSWFPYDAGTFSSIVRSKISKVRWKIFPNHLWYTFAFGVGLRWTIFVNPSWLPSIIGIKNRLIVKPWNHMVHTWSQIKQPRYQLVRKYNIRTRIFQQYTPLKPPSGSVVQRRNLMSQVLPCDMGVTHDWSDVTGDRHCPLPLYVVNWFLNIYLH